MGWYLKKAPQNTPKYRISAKSVRGFGSYEHLKFRPMHQLKYRLWRHNDVIAVTSQIFCYHCVEYIKLDACAKFHDHRSYNNIVMMEGPSCPPRPWLTVQKSPCQIGLKVIASTVEDDREDPFSLLEDSDVEEAALVVDSDDETDDLSIRHYFLTVIERHFLSSLFNITVVM